MSPFSSLGWIGTTGTEYVMGGLLLIAGVSKGFESARTLSAFRTLGIPANRFSLGALVAAEVGLGLCLVTGTLLKWTLPIATGLFLVLTGASLVLSARGHRGTCGCFGDLPIFAGIPVSGRNMVLTSMLAAAWWSRNSTIGWSTGPGRVIPGLVLAVTVCSVVAAVLMSRRRTLQQRWDLS